MFSSSAAPRGAIAGTHRSGRHSFYTVDLRGLTLLRTYLDTFWDDVLSAFQAAAIQESTKGDEG